MERGAWRGARGEAAWRCRVQRARGEGARRGRVERGAWRGRVERARGKGAWRGQNGALCVSPSPLPSPLFEAGHCAHRRCRRCRPCSKRGTFCIAVGTDTLIVFLCARGMGKHSAPFKRSTIASGWAAPPAQQPRQLCSWTTAGPPSWTCAQPVRSLRSFNGAPPTHTPHPHPTLVTALTA